jgi:hypothetical protein
VFDFSVAELAGALSHDRAEREDRSQGNPKNVAGARRNVSACSIQPRGRWKV